MPNRKNWKFQVQDQSRAEEQRWNLKKGNNLLLMESFRSFARTPDALDSKVVFNLLFQEIVIVNVKYRWPSISEKPNDRPKILLRNYILTVGAYLSPPPVLWEAKVGHLPLENYKAEKKVGHLKVPGSVFKLNLTQNSTFLQPRNDKTLITSTTFQRQKIYDWILVNPLFESYQ